MSLQSQVSIAVFCGVCVVQCALFARQWCNRSILSLLRHLRHHLARRQKEEFDLILSNEVGDRLCEAVSAMANILGAVWICWGLAVLLLPKSGAYVTDMQNHSMTVFNVLILGTRLCPKRMLRHLLPFVYIGIMACLVGHTYFSDTSNVYAPLRSMAIVNAFRVAVSFIFGQVFSTILCNSVVAVVNTYTIALIEEQLGVDVGGMLGVLAFELSGMAATAGLASFRRSSLERECSQSLKNRSLTIESSATTALLGLVCDVVVELDDDLRVAEHAPSLSAMLAIDRKTQGMALTQHMPHSSDVERFTEMLSKGSQDDGALCEPGAMHVTLRDSLSNMVPVEMFYVRFQGLGKMRNCFVGIREFADQPIAQLRPSRLTNAVQDAIASRQSLESHEKAAQPAGNGTTPVAKVEQLSNKHGPTSDKSSRAADDDAASAGSASGWKALDDRYELTSIYAKKMCVLVLLSQWNVSIPKKSCCPWHALLNDLRMLVKTMTREKCNESFYLRGDVQCEKCGLVLMEDKGNPLQKHCSGSGLRRGGPRKERPSTPSKAVLGL